MTAHPSDHVERYTPGHTPSAVAFMAERRTDTHAQFFMPHLTPGLSVLDLGCGPGSITVGIAAAVAPGPVIGIDQGAAQLDQARDRASRMGLTNVRFEAAS
jgi:ubiquinone/menaquinone biosynthesis C-methylase UbiE